MYASMPTHAQTPNVSGHKIEAITLNPVSRFLKNLTERIIVETTALKPNPPMQPKNKKDCNLLSFISGCELAKSPYIINPVTTTQSVQTKYSIRSFLDIDHTPLH